MAVDEAGDGEQCAAVHHLAFCRGFAHVLVRLVGIVWPYPPYQPESDIHVLSCACAEHMSWRRAVDHEQLVQEFIGS